MTVQLDLTPEERDILADILDHYASETRMEIADTDSMDFREMLKERKRVALWLRDLLREAV